MAWHRDSIGLLFEKLIFSIISFTTTSLLGSHLAARQQVSHNFGDFYYDATLYMIFIPLVVLDTLLICKVSMLFFNFKVDSF